jgi:hypothetical protein
VGSWFGPGRAQGRADGTPDPDRGLTTLKLHNDQETTQAAGFLSSMFGQSFRQGDMPAGKFPRFVTADGKTCAATLGGISSWPDGSMKFCAVLLRVPDPVAGRSTVDISVRAGNEGPGASTRRIGDLTAADLSVELTGVDGLQGVWSASLNHAISNGKVLQIANGPAGAVWRVRGPFRDGANQAHPQLYCDHYVQALTSGDGALYGLRYLPKVTNGWLDVPTDSRSRVATMTVKQAQATLLMVEGHTSAGGPLGANILFPAYGSVYATGLDARYLFVPRSGSATGDAAVRTSVDMGYWMRAKIVPPYDRRLSLGNWPAANYHPNGLGNCYETWSMPGTGERVEIGLFPEWAVRHIIQQTSANERAVRVAALAAGCWRASGKRSSTGQPVAGVDVRPLYAGLGASAPAMRMSPSGNYYAGVTVPAPNVSAWTEDVSHRPAATTWAYLVTGEPQYLDQMVEHACASILTMAPGTTALETTARGRKRSVWGGDRNIRLGMGESDNRTYKGAGILLSGGANTRAVAWLSRDVAQAAAFLPDVDPAGTAMRQYLRDVLERCYACYKAWIQAMPAPWRQTGFAPMDMGSNYWMDNFLRASLCHQSDISADPAIDPIIDFLSRTYEAYAASANAFGQLVSYRNSSTVGGQIADDMTHVQAILQTSSSSNPNMDVMSFSAVTQRAQFNPAYKISHPQNGDVVAFYLGEAAWDWNIPTAPFTGVTSSKPYYLVNVAPDKSFQLAESPNGAPVPFQQDTSVRVVGIRLQDLGARPSITLDSGYAGYAALMLGAINYMAATGRTNLATAQAKAEAVVTGVGTRYSGGKYKFLATRG